MKPHHLPRITLLLLLLAIGLLLGGWASVASRCRCG